MNDSTDRESSVGKNKAPLYISIALIGGLVVGYFFVPQIENFLDEAWNVLTSDDEKHIRSWVSGLGWLVLFMVFKNITINNLTINYNLLI